MSCDNSDRCSGLALRPYQALCAVCSLGREDDLVDDGGLIEMVRRTPDMAITLQCNVGDVFTFQDPGLEDDTPEGAEYNRLRDLEILLRLNLVPGSTVTGRILFNHLLDGITTVSGICGFEEVAGGAWGGCSRANSGDYERAREQGIGAIISPRSEEVMASDKRESLAAMHEAKTTGITIRPHILVCAVCQYGGGTRPPFKPDNLPELLVLIREEPETLITMAEAADWMMCAPCPDRCPERNACVNVKGAGGLTNQLRDLRTLQKLGLEYGSTMKAGELYKLIFERIPSTLEICRMDSPSHTVWWSNCGDRTTNNEQYAAGREMLMDEAWCGEEAAL